MKVNKVKLGAQINEIQYAIWVSTREIREVKKYSPEINIWSVLLIVRDIFYDVKANRAEDYYK